MDTAVLLLYNFRFSCHYFELLSMNISGQQDWSPNFQPVIVRMRLTCWRLRSRLELVMYFRLGTFIHRLSSTHWSSWGFDEHLLSMKHCPFGFINCQLVLAVGSQAIQRFNQYQLSTCIGCGVSVFIRPYRIIEFKAQLKFRYQVRPLGFISVIATTVGLLDIHM
jgi:NAD-dependent dihydropyrimidine dehydrogenase PreA subunit